jgi:hypothetical protein
MAGGDDSTDSFRARMHTDNYSRPGVSASSAWLQPPLSPRDLSVLRTAVRALGIAHLGRIIVACESATATAAAPHKAVTAEQALAIQLYTFNAEFYGKLNAVLLESATAGKPCESLSAWRDFLQHLLLALRCLPLVCGTVYRGVPVAVDPDRYAKGRRVVWPTFSSCSKTQEVAKAMIAEGASGWSGTFFSIRARNARSIAGLPLPTTTAQQQITDDEVILEPNSEFLVNEVIDLGYIVKVEMSQVEPSAPLLPTQAPAAVPLLGLSASPPPSPPLHTKRTPSGASSTSGSPSSSPLAALVSPRRNSSSQKRQQ